MTKKTGIFTFLLLSATSFAQVRIQVLDSESKKPIPYAKLILKDKNYYKNTEENGEAILEKGEKIERLESFGYESITNNSEEYIYYLKPTFTDIEEIEIPKPKFANTYTIGSIKDDDFGFMSGLITWEIINFFANRNKDKKTYIRKIKILTEVKKTKQDAVFNLVFYENIEGHTAPEKLKNMVVTCKKGKNITEIDFSDSPLTFPKEGLFIGVEWIMNEQNHYLDKTTVVHVDGSKEKNKIIDRINPFFFGRRSSASETLGRLSENLQQNNGQSFKFPNKHSLSMEIEVTD